MSYDKHRNIIGLAYSHEFIAAGSHLGYASRSRLNFCAVHCLNGIHYEKLRLQIPAYRSHILYVCFSQNKQIVAYAALAHPISSHFYLLLGLLPGHIQNLSLLQGNILRSLQNDC